MNTLQITSLIGLLVYFAVLLFAVSKDKANQNVLDYFFAGRSLPFWALSITFIASWWGAGSALSTADLAYTDGLSAFWYYGAPVLIATFLMIVVLTGMAGLVLFLTLPQGGVVTAVVVNYLPPVLGAIAFVGISAAVMSTMDSLINTGAMTLALDLNTKEQDENKKLRFSRAATLLVTVCALLIALGLRSILQISWMASMVVGLSYCLYNLLISAGLPLPSFWAAQSAQQVILGVSLSAAVYVAVSLCTKPDYEKADAFIAAANLLGRQKRPPQQK